MILLLSLAFNFFGLVAFAATMESHRHTFHRAPAGKRRLVVLRVAGGLAQLAALTLAIVAYGPGAGFVAWIIGWAICGFALTLFLARRAR